MTAIATRVTADRQPSLRRVAAVTLFDSSIQWYCFLLYGTAAGTVFDTVFFSQVSDRTTALILSYLSFAIGYIAGPFGAIFFGNLGDKHGRKFTMYTSLLTMGVSTAVIGLLPSAAASGVWVVVVLQLMRLLQCFGRGGTWGGSILMAYENVPENKRSLYAAIPQIGLPLGFGLSSLAIALPAYLLDEHVFLSWGWRFPFLLAVVLTAIVVYAKDHMMETEDFKKAQERMEQMDAAQAKESLGFIAMCKGYWRTLLLGCGTRWVDGTFYNIFIVWIMAYLHAYHNTPLLHTYIITIVACIFKIPFTFIGGHIAQRIGNAKTFMIGAVLSALMSIPTLKLIEWSDGEIFLTTTVIVLGWSGAFTLVWASMGALWSSYFEPEVRYSGISFVYHVPSFLVAGIVPSVCTYLVSVVDGDTILVGLFSTITAFISVLCAYVLAKRHAAGKR
ncbi:MFS transporter [Gleimia hominis]|uniref:MFS transporter n=1 Tax=Gleimia hominis TaxID=595468 RepID=UPI000C807AD2|nr:MFS transporter [Gleimia hominis]WIK65046.1 MFS transporter [Gleimia hominis]